MSRLVTLSLTTVVGLLLSAGHLVAQPASPPARPDAAAEVVDGTLGQQPDAIFTEATKDGSSGVVLLARGGKVLLRKGYGLADREARRPVRPDTAFCIGSNTKTYTAAAVLRLEQM